MTPFNYIYLQNYPIFQQLQLEEALLKADDRNWCLINEGSPKAIVLGISGLPTDFIDLNRWEENPVPLIKRFSGGGTVFVDENTLFVSFIGNTFDLQVPCHPAAVLEWTGSLYSHVFNGMDFRIRENDYAIGWKKFGGNAQYLRKNRWLHHSSLLWDYDPSNMNYLHLPKKIPKYREGRSHGDFLCTLKEYFPMRQEIIHKLLIAIKSKYEIKPFSGCIEDLIKKEHRKSTIKVQI